MRKYVERSDNIEIIKSEEDTKPKKKNLYESKKEVTSVPAISLLDTALSYQQAIFTSNSDENGGGECVFCGAHTAYDNRNVCVECWKKYNSEIFDGLKKEMSNIVIQIE